MCMHYPLSDSVFFYFILLFQALVWDCIVVSQNEQTDKTRFLPEATQRLNVSVVYLFLHRLLVHGSKVFFQLGTHFISLVLVTYSVYSLLSRIHGCNVTILEAFSHIYLMFIFCRFVKCLT